MWSQNLARGVLYLLSAEYSDVCSNVRGLAGNLSDLTVASSQYDILLCSETLVTDMRHVSEVLVPGIGCPVLLFSGQDGLSFRQPKFECGCCEMLFF